MDEASRGGAAVNVLRRRQRSAIRLGRARAARQLVVNARREGRIGIGNNIRCSRSQSEASMPAPLALAIEATAPALPAAGDLEASAMFARDEKAPVTRAACRPPPPRGQCRGMP
jgi:hypothetical protein